MRIELFPTPAEAAESRVRDREAVVIDVLRASTSIAFSWRNGAQRIIPVSGVEEAKAIQGTFKRGQALLCGERDGLKIDGFDLGNSPAEFVPESVRGKALIFCSTNGTGLMARNDGAREKAVASFVNLSAAAEYVSQAGTDIAILCAGKLGRLSLEDFVCGGAVVEEVLARVGEGAEVNDAALAARRLWDGAYRGRVLQLLRETSHGRYLVSIGFEKDLELCAKRDSVPLVPVVREGRIVR